MRDTLTTIGTGATGVIASVGADTIVKGTEIAQNVPQNASLLIQLAIGVCTLASLIIQTFFRKKKGADE